MCQWNDKKITNCLNFIQADHNEKTEHGMIPVVAALHWIDT